MKTLIVKYFCVEFKLYQIGMLIGVISTIANTIASVYVLGYFDFNHRHYLVLHGLLILSSMFLVCGLLDNNHAMLFPFVSNLLVLIIADIIDIFGLFGSSNWEITLLIGKLVVEVIVWCAIFKLLLFGYERSFQEVNAREEI